MSSGRKGGGGERVTALRHGRGKSRAAAAGCFVALTITQSSSLSSLSSLSLLMSSDAASADDAEQTNEADAARGATAGAWCLSAGGEAERSGDGTDASLDDIVASAAPMDRNEPTV